MTLKCNKVTGDFGKNTSLPALTVRRYGMNFIIYLVIKIKCGVIIAGIKR